MSTFERADRRWNTNHPVATTCPIQVPLVCFRIVEAQAETFQVTGWSICMHFDQTGASIPNGSYLGNTVVLQPFGRSNQLPVEPRHVHLPMSVIEIEVMRSEERRVGKVGRLR